MTLRCVDELAAASGLSRVMPVPAVKVEVMMHPYRLVAPDRGDDEHAQPPKRCIPRFQVSLP